MDKNIMEGLEQIEGYSDVCGDYGVRLVKEYGHIDLENGDDLLKHIIKCVNEHEELKRKEALLDEALECLEAMFNIARECEVQLKATDFSLCGLTEDDAEKLYRHDAFCEIWDELQSVSEKVRKVNESGNE